MAFPLSGSSPRRSFLQRLVAGTAALAAGGWSTAAAEPRFDGIVPPDDSWITRIKGKHRQLFDATEPNEGFGPVFALTWLETTKEALNVPDSDMTAVVVLRHFAMPLALNDDIWAKYRIGALLNVTDPTTKVAAVRNVFRENVPLHPGLTYKELAADPRVVLTACNKALTVISMMAGQQIGVAPDVAKREFTQGLLPGFSLVASGVYAVHRAQQAGCTYCKA